MQESPRCRTRSSRRATPRRHGATVELAPGRPIRRRAPRARSRTSATSFPGSSPSAASPTGGAPSASRGSSTARVYDFLYRYWFRVEVEGIENVPADGPALLVANHSGALPSDAAMIAKAVREEHRRPRPVHLLTEQPLGARARPRHAVHEARRRRGAPRQPPPSAVRRGAARAAVPRRAPRRPQAAEGALPAAQLRPRGFVRARRAPARRSYRSPSSAPRRRSPVFGAAERSLRRLTRLPLAAHTAAAAGEVQDPLPRAGRDGPARARETGELGSAMISARSSRRTCSRWSRERRSVWLG